MRLGGLLNRTPTQKSRSIEEAEAIEEAEDMLEYKPTLTMTPERSSRVGTPRTQTPARATTLADRFAWFAQSRTDEHGTPSRTRDASNLSDPLLNLHINTALFPNGNADPASPNAFDDLLRNSTALITRLQDGYREKTTLLRASYDERDATVEESSEATTRAEHLRSQLEAMAARAAEQDRAMQVLADQLSQERQAREELSSEVCELRRQHHHPQASTTRDTDDADLITPRRAPQQPQTPRRLRSPRISDGDSTTSGFDSDADCDSTIASTYSCSGSSAAYSLDSASSIGTPATPSSSSIAGGVASSFDWDGAKRDVDRKLMGGNVAGSGTMGGAWGIVGELQRENAKLKTRVRDLEGAVEGVLSLVA